MLTHLAGPNWDVPPKTPEALKLWRSEIKRTVENFEEDVWKIAEALKEKNAGYDPENYKINGQVRFLFFTTFEKKLIEKYIR